MKLFGNLASPAQSAAAWVAAGTIAYFIFSRPTAATTLTTSDLDAANAKKKAALDAKGLK